jgi:hypothetical protein
LEIPIVMLGEVNGVETYTFAAQDFALIGDAVAVAVVAAG